MVKIMSEVKVGMVQNIVATENVDIYLIDHDNLDAGDDAEEMIEEPTHPDHIIPSADFDNHLHDAIVNA